MAVNEKGCEAIGGGCFWAEFWESYEPLANFLAHDGFRNGALVIAAIVTLFIAIWRAKTADEDKLTSIRKANIQETGLNIDRFQKGAAMLGDDKVSVRQAGILILSQLAQQSFETYFDMVQQLLCSLIRTRSLEQCKNAGFEKVTDVGFEEGITPDIEYAINELSKLGKQRDLIEPSGLIIFNLVGSNFRGASLNDGSLKDSWLMETNFCQTHISKFDLSQSYFNLSTMERSEMINVALNSTKLVGTKLTMASILSSNFKDAQLYNSNFQNTVFHNCNFEGANLSKSNFEGAKGVSYDDLVPAANVDSVLMSRLLAEKYDSP